MILVVFIWKYFFASNYNYIIFSSGGEPRAVATNIVYYGPDIGSKDEFYSGRRNTNGIICIYSLYSRFDEYKNQNPLYIVGDVLDIENTNSQTTIRNYNYEIDKFYYINWFDYDY